MTEKNLRALFGLIASVLTLLVLLLFLLYEAMINGILGYLVIALVVLSLAAAFGFSKFAEGIRTLIEAFKIRGATSYEVTHDASHRRNIKIVDRSYTGYPQLPPGMILNDAASAPLHPSVTDHRRPAGMALLEATINDPKYGPESEQIMTQGDAVTKQLIVVDQNGKQFVMNADLWQMGIDYLRDYFRVTTYTNRGSKNGTYTTTGNVSDILHDSIVLVLPPGDRSASAGAARESVVNR